MQLKINGNVIVTILDQDAEYQIPIVYDVFILWTKVSHWPLLVLKS